MCKHQVLAHNDNGYIVLCKKCKNFQIAFGTTVIYLSEILYEEFKIQLDDQFHLYSNDGFPKQKIIQLQTFNENVHIVVSFNELLKLIELIEQASILIQVERLVENKHNYTTKLK